MTEEKKLDLQSLDITELHKDQLKKIFPEVFNEDKIDFEKLRVALGDDIDMGRERFGMTWPGKTQAKRVAQEPSTATLKPDREASVNFDTTQNLFIEGDNLEVLKLLQKSYFGKIKMIYIDPPYNTGKEFIYPDKYEEGLKTYLQYTGQVDAEGRKFSSTTESDGRYHSKWMNMMWPRLALARNLLTEDGVIFMSIDDHEVDNLKKICNEVFGEENFITEITRKTKLTSNKGTFFAPSHEYILVYAKSVLDLNQFNDNEAQNEDEYIKLFKYEDDYSKYNIVGLYQPSLDSRPNQRYYIECPDGSHVIPPGKTFPKIVEDGSYVKPNGNYDKVWRWSFDSYLKYDKSNLVFKKTKTSPLINENGEQAIWNVYTKIYLKDRLNDGMRPVTTISKYPNSEASKELIKMRIPFDFSKPKNLIKYLIKIQDNNRSGIILDFFAGSGTTAHAVMQLNTEDGGNRKFIMTQLPELVDENSEAYKAGYRNIAQIGEERIRRAGAKIVEENKDKDGFNAENFDRGFKVYKLTESNFTQWDGTKKEDLPNTLKLHVNHIASQSTEEDLLSEILLKSGHSLTEKIEEVMIDDKKINVIGEGDLIICLEKNITKETMQKVVDRGSKMVICLNDGFTDNADLTNAAKIMENAQIEFRTV